MARDRKRNAYFTIGIPKSSDTYKVLQADAKETGLPMARLLGVRIADWYGIASRGMVLPSPATQPAERIPEQQATALKPMQSRALAAAAAWGGTDDD